MKFIVLFFYLITNLYSYEKLYFLPQDKKEFQHNLYKQILNAKVSIKIAMYNFTYKKIAKILKEKSKEGIQVIVYYSKSDIDFFHKINTKRITHNKLHTKLALIDNKMLIFGSANWTKNALNKNYEMVVITDNSNFIQKSNFFFNTLEK